MVESQFFLFEPKDWARIATFDQLKREIRKREAKDVSRVIYCLRKGQNEEFIEISDTEGLNHFKNEDDFKSQSIYFSYFYDFFIVHERGCDQCGSVKVGEHFNKEWVIQFNFEVTDVSMVCIEGDFLGLRLEAKPLNQNQAKFKLSELISPPARWSSSIWKVCIQDRDFGPLLWTEVNFK